MFRTSARLFLYTVNRRANSYLGITAELSTCTSYSTSSGAVIHSKPLAPVLFHYDVKTDHNGHAPTNGRTNIPQYIPGSDLISLFEDLSINSGLNPETALNTKQQKYILPTISDAIQKKILDPEVIQHKYEMPTFHSTVREKLTPGLESFVPKIDPSHLQRAIDEGSAPLVKISMPYLLRIRRHKMKKHKLKKFRKRMIFLHRKLSEIKKRKKQQRLVEFQQMWAKRAASFDPEKQLEDQLLLARKGGYGVPLFPGKSNQ